MVSLHTPDAWRPSTGMREPVLAGRVTQWHQTDNENAYKRAGNPYTPDSFDYRFNQSGFRCDEFPDRSIPQTFRVLFAGCSVTMGVGLPLDEVYAHLAITKLREESGLPLPFWNVGVGGASSDKIARLVTLGTSVLRPHVVFCLFPPTSRRELCPGDGSIMSYVPKVPGPLHEQVMAVYSRAGERYEFVKNLTMVDIACQLIGATFMWGCCAWNEEATETIPPHLMEKRLANFPQGESQPRAQDGLHRGAGDHATYAKGLIDALRPHLCDFIVKGKD
jgi:hypothetical protein